MCLKIINALEKFSNEDEIDKYLNKYVRVELVLISGEKIMLSRQDALSKKKRIKELYDRHIISKVYKIFDNGKKIKVDL